MLGKVLVTKKGFNNMASVLVTGGAGFIGSHLVPLLLENGFKVRVLDIIAPQIHGNIPGNLEWLNHPQIEFIRGSVNNRRDVQNALRGITDIIHLAAETGTGQSMYEVAHYNQVNSQGTALILDVLANTPGDTVGRFVLSSSRSVYGEGAYTCASCNEKNKRIFPHARTAEQLSLHRWEPHCPTCNGPLKAIATREADPVRPASIYAATKYAQEDLVRIACEALGIDFAILRLQNVYGEGQSLKNPYTGILSIFSTRVRRDLELTAFEDGLESRDFVHVEDVVNAMLRCLMSPRPIKTIINIGSGIPTSVTEVATKLTEAMGETPKVRVTGEYRLGDIRHNFAEIDRLKTVLGYEPKVSLEVGLRRFAKWLLTQSVPEDLLDKANAELRARKLMG
jgi:dTDP-L-rhamnose 4-epimerase